MHGFDEFYGILYHLNAMEEPYEGDFPEGQRDSGNSSVRAISKATTVNRPTDPRWGRVGEQTIADGGPLPHPGMDPAAKVNMENIDPELVRRSNDFMERSVKANKPFFLWHNSTRTHSFTHLDPKWQDKSGFGLYADAMMELDWEVGELLREDRSARHHQQHHRAVYQRQWREKYLLAGWRQSPLRGEKGTVFEGGFRIL